MANNAIVNQTAPRDRNSRINFPTFFLTLKRILDKKGSLTATFLAKDHGEGIGVDILFRKKMKSHKASSEEEKEP